MRQINIKEYFQQEKEKLRQSTRVVPSLLIIDATDGDIGNQIYIRKKIEDFESVGWKTKIIKPKNQTEYINILSTLSNPWSPHSIHFEYTSVIVQLPMSNRFTFKNTDILPIYDCDGLNPNSLIMPATVRGIIDYLDACEFEYKGKNAIVIGRSEIVGKPMAKALLDRDMTVSILHSKTQKESFYDHLMFLKPALVVSAVGKPHLFSREDVSDPMYYDNRSNSIVIDVGISRDQNNKLCGDFDEQPHDGIGWSTPVPGGVGLLTRLGLMKNCKELAERK